MSATVCINDGHTHNSPVEATEAKAPVLLVQRARWRQPGLCHTLQAIQCLRVVGQDPVLSLLADAGHLSEHCDGVELT